MASTQPTFELIKSLSKGEKRLVSLNAGKTKGGKKSIYIELFNLLDKQKNYSQEKVLAAPMALKKSRLSNILNYLSNLILDSIRYQDDNKNIVSELQLILSDINIYQAKLMLGAASKSIQKLKKLAYKYEKYNYILEAIRLERRLMKYSNDIDEFKKTISSTIAEEKKLLKIIDQEIKLNELFFSIYAIYLEIGSVRTTEQQFELDKVIASDLLKSNFEDSSFLSNLLRINSFIIYNEVYKNENEALNYRLEMVDMFDQNPHFIEEDVENYISSLNNLLIGLKNTNQHELFFKYLDNLKVVNKKVRNGLVNTVNDMVFERGSVLELDYYVKNKRYEDGVNLSEGILLGIELFSKSITKMRLFSICLQLSFCYLMTEDLKKAKTWINKIIHVSDLKMRRDLYYAGRILNLLIHFESDNFDYLEYEIEATKRKLEKKNVLYDYERFIIKELKSYIISGEKDKQQFYKNFLKAINAFLADNNLESDPIYGFNLIEFVSSKI